MLVGVEGMEEARESEYAGYGSLNLAGRISGDGREGEEADEGVEAVVAEDPSIPLFGVWPLDV